MVSEVVKMGLNPKVLIMMGLAVVLSSMFLIGQDTARAHYDYHNITRGKEVSNWGVYAVVEITDPDLNNNGQWTYQRAATVQRTPLRFGEIGWLKTTTETKTLAVWTDANGVRQEFDQPFNTSYSKAHFAVEYHPGSGKHRFFRGYSNPPSWIVSKNTGLPSGEAEWAMCGGETTGSGEDMGYTRCGNDSSNGLQYMATSGGSSYTNWGSHDWYNAKAHGYNYTDIDDNNFDSYRIGE